MTPYYNHPNQKDFVCVDKDPEYVPGTNGNKGGALLYFVEGAVVHFRALHMFCIESWHACAVGTK